MLKQLLNTLLSSSVPIQKYVSAIVSEINRKVLRIPALRTEPITTPNQENISPLMLYSRFLCCTALNRRRMMLQSRPRYWLTNLFSEPVDSSASEQNYIMSSEPTDTSVLKCIRTDKPIISTPLHDMSYSSVRDLSAYTVLCRTKTNELKIELMWPEEDTELLHDLSFLECWRFQRLVP